MAKCLTIRQPWAGLILIGTKDVENRTWGTDYHGPLLIHAGRKWGAFERQVLDSFERQYPEHAGHPLLNVRGCILGQVTLMNCRYWECAHGAVSRWHEQDMIGWYLKDPVVFERAIKYRGQLGLFNIPDEVVTAAIHSLERTES